MDMVVGGPWIFGGGLDLTSRFFSKYKPYNPVGNSFRFSGGQYLYSRIFKDGWQAFSVVEPRSLL
jgi:hypothetical protein